MIDPGFEAYSDGVVMYHQYRSELELTMLEARQNSYTLEAFEDLCVRVSASPELIAAYCGVLNSNGRHAAESAVVVQEIEKDIADSMYNVDVMTLGELEKEYAAVSSFEELQTRAERFTRLFRAVIPTEQDSEPPVHSVALNGADTDQVAETTITTRIAPIRSARSIERTRYKALEGDAYAARTIIGDDHEPGFNQDAMSIYLADISRHPLLTKEGAFELGMTVKNARPAKERLENPPPDYDPTQRHADMQAVKSAEVAKKQLIRANLRLVVSIVKRYPKHPGIDIMDLVQEGNLGLEHSVDKYDPEKGFTFSTYSTYWIRQASGRAYNRLLRRIVVPDDVSQGLRKYEAGLDDEISEEDMMVDHDWTPKDIAKLKAAHQTGNVLSTDTTNDEGSDLGDIIKDPAATKSYLDFEGEWLFDDLVKCVEEILDEDELDCFKMRLGFNERGKPYSYREMGDVYGVTAEAARRRYKRVISKLNAPNNFPRLDQYREVEEYV